MFLLPKMSFFLKRSLPSLISNLPFFFFWCFFFLAFSLYLILPLIECFPDISTDFLDGGDGVGGQEECEEIIISFSELMCLVIFWLF